jgi:hypothetical protein
LEDQEELFVNDSTHQMERHERAHTALDSTAAAAAAAAAAESHACVQI